MSENPEIPENVLKLAWEAGEGVHQIGDYRAVKDRKMIVISPAILAEGPKGRAHFRTVVFPRSEHFGEFKEASNALQRGGPVGFNQGSVGSTFVYRRARKKPFYLDLAQAHFKTSRGATKDSQVFGIRRSLATQYQGWRVRALREAIGFAERYKTELRIPASTADTGKFEEDIRRVCRDMDIRLRRMREKWVMGESRRVFSINPRLDRRGRRKIRG
ncbi:MAG: hypothetical protein JXB14_00245 [Candidatus Altiarchaeota archaeon]|nr:hypothetical protein [Candidatus Altiarchaeota archaeon]